MRSSFDIRPFGEVIDFGEIKFAPCCDSRSGLPLHKIITIYV